MKRLVLVGIAMGLATMVPFLQTAHAQSRDRDHEFTVQRNIEYARAGNHALLLDLYLPRNAVKPYPLVIRIHGGGWRSGSKDSKEGIGLTKLGFALASIDYRLSRQATFPAQIHDCKAAVRFLRANATTWGIDGTRIGVWGTSAGGHLAALLGTTGDMPELEGDLGNPGVSSRVQAVLDASGPTDLTAKVGQGDRVEMLFGGSPSEHPELARAASPILFITPDDPPFLVLNGARDLPALVEQGRQFADVLQKTGVPVQYYVIPRAGHDVMEFIREDPKLAPMPFNFFQYYLR